MKKVVDVEKKKKNVYQTSDQSNPSYDAPRIKNRGITWTMRASFTDWLVVDLRARISQVFWPRIFCPIGAFLYSIALVPCHTNRQSTPHPRVEHLTWAAQLVHKSDSDPRPGNELCQSLEFNCLLLVALCICISGSLFLHSDFEHDIPLLWMQLLIHNPFTLALSRFCETTANRNTCDT